MTRLVKVRRHRAQPVGLGSPLFVSPPLVSPPLVSPPLVSPPLVSLLLGSLLLVILSGSTAEAIERTVYRYRAVTGQESVAVDPPPGATILDTVGTIDVPLGQLLVDRALLRLVWQPERIWSEVGREPLASGLCVAMVLLLALLALRVIPPIFSTHDLDLRGAGRMLVAILAGVATLAVLGRGVDYLADVAGYAPDEGVEQVRDVIGYALYAGVVVYAFWRRLAPRLMPAVLLAGGWLALLVGAILALWSLVMPSLTPHL